MLSRESRGKSARAKRDTKKGAKTCPFGSSMVSLKSAQVLERNGGDDGTRTRGLCRDSISYCPLNVPKFLIITDQNLSRLAR
jgi:hypothetical protein